LSKWVTLLKLKSNKGIPYFNKVEQNIIQVAKKPSIISLNTFSGDVDVFDSQGELLEGV